MIHVLGKENFCLFPFNLFFSLGHSWMTSSNENVTEMSPCILRHSNIIAKLGNGSLVLCLRFIYLRCIFKDGNQIWELSFRIFLSTRIY